MDPRLPVHIPLLSLYFILPHLGRNFKHTFKMVLVENEILSQNYENDDDLARTTSANFVDDWENPEKSIPKPNLSIIKHHKTS